MAKRIVAKTGEYQKDGQSKGEYTNLGVMLNNNNGDYMLLDPSVNLAGVLIKQNALAVKKGAEQRNMVMISIFEDDNQNQGMNQNQQQAGFQQQAPQQGGFNQQNQSQGGFSQQQPAPQQGGFASQQQSGFNPQQ